MTTETEARLIAKRKLMLRDSLAILSLALVTAALFVVTLLLFRSFSTHRAELAQRWSDRGRKALDGDKPDEAIADLRTALTYAPGTRDYILMLAQALGETGRPEESEESYQYFMSLWDAEPGYGPINLELARLARKRRDEAAAVNFYRAAIYGTWEGDGVVRRASARMELAQYLIEQDQLPAARMELLIVGGNAPDDYGRDMAIGGLLEQAQDANDAMTFYQRAEKARRRDPAAKAAIERLQEAAAAALAAEAEAAETATQNAAPSAAEAAPAGSRYVQNPAPAKQEPAPRKAAHD